MTLRRRNGWRRWMEVDSTLRPRPTDHQRAVARPGLRNLLRQGHRPGVVTVHPIGVGLPAEPRVGARGLLDTFRARLARRLEAAKCICNTITFDAVEAARQHRGV